VKQIEAIKFAIDWKRKGRQSGGRAYKRNFVQRAFDRAPEHANLRPRGTVSERATYERALKTFRIRHGKIITARNYLLKLYEQVRRDLSCV
jgi:hypothetical protein